MSAPDLERTADLFLIMIAAQLTALKQLVDAAPANVRDTILMAHAESIKGQLTGQTLSQEEVTNLTRLVSDSSFNEDQKAMLMVQMSHCLLQRSGNETKSGQKVIDLAPYLLKSEWTSLKGPLSLKSKLQVLAVAYGRLCLWFPNEPSCGLAVSLLMELGCNDELKDAQTYNTSLVCFKDLLKDLRKKKGVTKKQTDLLMLYSGNVKDMPKELYNSAFEHEGPSTERPERKTVTAGPLRKSDRRIAEPATGSRGPSQAPESWMHGMMTFASMIGNFTNKANEQKGPEEKLPEHKQPQENPPEQKKTPPEKSALPIENQPPPISPAKQARMMMDNWEDNDKDEADAGGARGRGRGRGRGRRGRSNGGNKAMQKSAMKTAMKASAGTKSTTMKTAMKSTTMKAMKVMKMTMKNMKKPAAMSMSSQTHRGNEVAGLTWAERLRRRPNGCSGCRWKPGCCPSCWKRQL